MTQDGPNICLYGCANGATFKTEYHLLPCSATQFNLVLPPGYVCDKCNNYFSELENYFTHYHPGSSNRLLAINKTRKGKEPVLKATTGDVTRKIHGKSMNLQIPLESLKSETQSNGDIKFHGVYPVTTSGRGRTLEEWKQRPDHPDNHWFDCLVGCAAGASIRVWNSRAFQPIQRSNAYLSPNCSRTRGLRIKSE
jgi:hypothetical protein